jgi:shikimate dehydrogenase
VSSHVQRIRTAFAAIEGDRATSPGAVRIGLLGRGIGASLTPIMHEAEGRRLGLGYRYDLIDFDRYGLADSDLGAVLAAARRDNFRGLNVTYPFKQAIVPLLDQLSSEAAAIGAVNTVVLRPEGTSGHNTDCWGFAQSLRQGLGPVALDRVIQFGAGGAGAAVAHALVEAGAGHVAIVDADRDKADSLALSLSTATGAAVNGVGLDDIGTVLASANGIVNATPVGMDKHPGTPFDPDLLSARQWVADIIYFPRETELLRRARALGCPVLPGGGMAVYQAVRAFELFTEIAPDAAEMRQTFAAYA